MNEINPGLLNSAYNSSSGNLSDLSKTLYKNPITGEDIRLDAKEFSPGDIYIRLLTEEEKQYFASKFNFFQHHWYEGWRHNYITGEDECASVIGGIFYIRVYGLTDVIYEQIIYKTVAD